MSTRLLDLLGIPPGPLSGRVAAAVARWPASRINHIRGLSGSPDVTPLIEYLQDALDFRAVRPGAGPEAVGIEAELHITNGGTTYPLVFGQMPDIGFQLLDTHADAPARVYATVTDTGTEVVIEGLPVEIQLPSTLLGPLRSREDEQAHPGGGPDVPLAGPFRTDAYDSFEVVLREPLDSSIKVHVKVRLTEELDVVIEPAVPISFGPCRFTGLPALAVHDLNFVPSPTLEGDHEPGEQAFEWTRHPIDRLMPGAALTGMLTVRTVDLDSTRPPLSDLMPKMNAERPEAAGVEFVLQDLALPLFNIVNAPIPAHGLVGLRRPIAAGDSAAEAFAFAHPLPSGTFALTVAAGWKEPFAGRLLIDQLLIQTPASLEPLDQFLFFQMALQLGEDAEKPLGSGTTPSHVWTIGLSDEWTVQAGHREGTGFELFKIADAKVAYWGAKLGFSIKRGISKDPPYEWYEMFQVLLDLSLRVEPSNVGGKKSPVQLRSLSGKEVEVVMRDVGWNLGEPAASGLTFPEGMQLIFGDVVRFIVEEMAWLTDTNGGRYFSFSGGVSIFPGAAKVNASPAVGSGTAEDTDKDGNGLGIRFRRLRYRVGGNPEAPDWLLDGISLLLQLGPVRLTGFGMISQFTENGHDYDELAFGLKVEVGFGPARFQLGAQLAYGKVKGPVDNFTYWLFGLQVSPIPAGPVTFVDVRGLFASNMAPSLPPPDGFAQNMRILRWYHDHHSAVDMPPDRKLAAWHPEDSARAFGAGLGIRFGDTDVVTIDGFFFWHESLEEDGFLVLIEVFLGKGKKPIVVGALEVDSEHGRWGAVLGLAITLDTVLGTQSAWLKNLGGLTGTLYLGNEPTTRALGHIADPATWLTLKFGASGILDCSVTLALCVELVEDGPHAVGFLFSAKGGRKFGIGQVQGYVILTLLVGTWRNESSAAGLEAHLELALRVKVFYVFNVGIHADAQFDYLATDPSAKHLRCTFTIETPWWLPDASFHLDKKWGEPVLSEISIASTPIAAADATHPGTLQQATLGVTPLVGAAIDATGTYTLDTLRGTSAQTLPDATIGALTPVSLDTVIGVNFKQPVDSLTVVEATPAGAGKQTANQLDITYELVSIGVRRRPRFGTVRTWSDLVASSATHLQTPADFPPDAELDAWFEATQLGYWWDRDMQDAGALSPKRLLINAATPYTFATANPIADENTASTEPHWPCCDGGRKDVTWHVVDFTAIPFGVRAPTTQRFTDSASTLHWLMRPSPVVVPGVIGSSGAHVAAVDAPETEVVVAVASFDARVDTFELLVWSQHFHTHEGELIVEGFDGLEVVTTATVALDSFTSPTIRLAVPAGMTSVVIRFRGGPELVKLQGWVELQRAQYRTVAEVVADRLHDVLCDRRAGQALEGGGRLAWLPNHEYEVTLEVRLVVGYAPTGAQDATVIQRAYFATKGLPGLNAVERVGDELEPYVESRYGRDLPSRLYRSEPVAIAFDERFNVLVPVDRVLSPTAPPERNQLLEWTLVVERVAGSGEARRLSVTSADWVVIHRGTGGPIRWRPVVSRTGEGHMRTVTRTALTLDPVRVRFETMATRPGGCPDPPSLARSQVLVHNPVDPADTGVGAATWAPEAHHRVSVRIKDAPFVDRRPFEEGDETAFTMADHGRMFGTAWTLAAGALAPSVATDGIRHFAVFGDSTWDHMQVFVDVDPSSGEAGVAMGVAGLPNITEAILAVVSNSRLRLLELRRAVVTELASAALPSGAVGPFALRVVAYDDFVRAEVGDVRIEAPRTDIRSGRLALVAIDGGAFTSLVVDSIDAYRFDVQTSRFETFEQHIATFSGQLLTWTPLPGVATDSVPALLASTGSAIATTMTPLSDRETRQRVFDQWVAALAVPIGKGGHAPQRLLVTRVGSGATADALLIESPEPLPFSADVAITIAHWVPGGFGGWGDIGGRDDLGNLHLAMVTDEVGRAAERARWLVHSPADGEPVATFDVGRVTGRPRTMVPIAHRVDAATVAVRPDPGTAVFVDANGEAIGGPFPVNPGHWEDVPARVLSDGDETRAFVIPTDASGHAVALPARRYRLQFAIDRSRWRADAPDAASNYRATADVYVTW
jgi:hypothetical protein